MTRRRLFPLFRRNGGQNGGRRKRETGPLRVNYANYGAEFINDSVRSPLAGPDLGNEPPPTIQRPVESMTEDLREPAGSLTGETLDRHEVALRAGVALEFVRRLTALGILSPDEGDRFSPGDVRRVMIVRTLERAGVPLDGIGNAVRSGLLSLAFADTSPTSDRFAPLSDITFADLSERSGVPVELLMVIREAVDFAHPRPNDRVREEELLIVPLVELQYHNGVRPLAIERLLRVYGDSLRRVAESEADWWHTEVMPLLSAGIAPTARIDAVHELMPQLARLSDDALLVIYHSQQSRPWTQGFIENVESALEAAGLHRRLERCPS